MGDHNYQLAKATIDADLKVLEALVLLPDYLPMNTAYNREALALLLETYAQAKNAQKQLDGNFEQARYARAQGRDVLNSTAHQIHAAALGFKEQVVAQYGKDSRAVELVGYVRKSDWKRPARRKVTE